MSAPTLFPVNKAKSPQSSFHVKKNDEVVVISGKNRGRRGRILEILRERNRVVIEGVNLIKKAVQKSQGNPQGGIIEKEGPLHISNVMLAEEFDKRAQESKK
jgi:large subunit ribosomal protein L24